MSAPKPPRGWRFDPFADVRMGRSLFQMQPEDWLIPGPDPAEPGDPDYFPDPADDLEDPR